MEIINIIIKIIGLIIMAIGVVMIYDARRIIKKIFSLGEQNSSSKILKITGFIISIIGAFIVIIKFIY